KAARLQKVALHVDNDERRPADVDLKRIRFGLDPDWHSIPRSRRGELRKFGAKCALLYAKDSQRVRHTKPLIYIANTCASIHAAAHGLCIAAENGGNSAPPFITLPRLDLKLLTLLATSGGGTSHRRHER